MHGTLGMRDRGAGRRLSLGLGCTSDAAPEEAVAIVLEALAGAGVAPEEVDRVATLDRLATHPAVVAVAARLGAHVVTYRSQELDAVPVPTPSEHVRDRTGTQSVAEAAALLAAGQGRLLVPKRARRILTIAVAEPGPRLRLRGVPAAVHGGASPLPVDLTASLNPLGPSPRALVAARAARLDRYPEPDAAALRRAAAAHHGLDEAAVVPVPGAAFGLWLAMLALLVPGDAATALGPCFGEYARNALMAGAILREARTGADELWDEAAITAALAGGPVLCVLANPNNPTGRRIPAEVVRRACATHPETRFLVDEAFAAFARPGASLLDEGPPPANAVVVRSLTKELGLPGLRMGYLVAAPELAGELAGLLPAWPLSSEEVDAAVAGLGDDDHLRRGVEEAHRQVAAVADALHAAGLRPLPTDTTYLLCRAPGLLAHMAAAGIAVRDCASFGLPDHVRIAAPRPEDAAAVLAAIRAFDAAG